MSLETRAGLVKIATLSLAAGTAYDVLAAAGDEWIAADEIRRVSTEAFRPAAQGGGAQSATRIEMKSGHVLRTAAAIAAAGGLLEGLEGARATLATAQFGPLVEALQERATP